MIVPAVDAQAELEKVNEVLDQWDRIAEESTYQYPPSERMRLIFRAALRVERKGYKKSKLEHCREQHESTKRNYNRALDRLAAAEGRLKRIEPESMLLTLAQWHDDLGRLLAARLVDAERESIWCSE